MSMECITAPPSCLRKHLPVQRLQSPCIIHVSKLQLSCKSPHDTLECSFTNQQTACAFITRYILREVTSHALLGGALFTFVIFMRDLGKHPRLRRARLRHHGPTSPASSSSPFPLLSTVTIPMAVLVGILLGLSRLAADSEITAMRASAAWEQSTSSASSPSSPPSPLHWASSTRSTSRPARSLRPHRPRRIP